MQDITAMKSTTTHKKIREIGGALGKLTFFSYYVSKTSTHLPSNFGNSLPIKFMFLEWELLVSRPLPTFPERISQIQYAGYNSYEKYYHPQKN